MSGPDPAAIRAALEQCMAVRVPMGFDDATMRDLAEQARRLIETCPLVNVVFVQGEEWAVVKGGVPGGIPDDAGQVPEPQRA